MTMTALLFLSLISSCEKEEGDNWNTGPGPVISLKYIPDTVAVGEMFTVDATESEAGVFPLGILKIKQTHHSSIIFNNDYTTLRMQMSFEDPGPKVLWIYVIEEHRGWSCRSVTNMYVTE